MIIDMRLYVCTSNRCIAMPLDSHPNVLHTVRSCRGVWASALYGVFVMSTRIVKICINAPLETAARRGAVFCVHVLT